MWFIKRYVGAIILAIVVGLLCVMNYSPNTWLTGWDNLHTEFSHSLGIERSLFGVWQEYQGLGLLAGMAHAADILRVIFVYVLDIFLPTIFVRYSFHFIMLFAGVFGVYALMRKIASPLSPFKKEVVSVFSALLYVFNFGAAQTFFVPFEPFSVFFGLLPWQILTALIYLEKPTRKHLLSLAVVHLLATPEAYVQTVFFVYLLFLSIISAWSIIINKNIKNVFILWVVVIGMNMFWILPNVYFTLKSVSTTQMAVNNLMNADRFIDMNKQYGTLTQAAVLKGFMWAPVNSPVDYFKPWRNHFQELGTMEIGYVFFTLSCLGLLVKSRYRLLLSGMFSLSLFVLLSDTPLIRELHEGIRHLPLISQIFRNPFTKFVTPAALIYALLAGQGLSWILQRFNTKKAIGVVAGALMVLLMWYVKPAWQGSYISPEMRVSIPQSYFDLFDYLKTQKSGARIANLPQDSYWGWGRYTWGPTGSGFLWYGIKQPILDRAFDVWSSELEGYYWKLTYALKHRDIAMLNAVFNEYDVEYLLFDESYIPSDSADPKVLLKQEELLSNNPNIVLDRAFGPMRLYRFLGNKKPYGEGALVEPFGWFSTQSPEGVSPFGSLFTGRPVDDNLYSITSDSGLTLTRTLPSGKWKITIPSQLDESLVPFRVFGQQVNGEGIVTFEALQPSVTIGGKEIKTQGYRYMIRIPTSENIVAYINDEKTLAIPIGENAQYAGTVYLNGAPLINSLSFFSATGNVQRLPGEAFSLPYECMGGPNGNNNTGTIELRSSKNPMCSVSLSPLRLEPQSLILTEYAVNNSPSLRARTCLYVESTGSCLEKTSFYSGTGEDGYLSLSYIPYHYPSDTEGRIEYSDISVTQLPFISAHELVLSPTAPETQLISTRKPETFRIYIPYETNDVSESFTTAPFEYDVSQITEQPLAAAGIQNSILTATRGMVSSWYRLERDPAVAYALTLDGTSKGQRPQLIVDTGVNQVKQIQTLLKDRSFDRTIIIPPGYEYDKNMSIGFNTYSYTDAQSQLSLNHLSLHPIPFRYITQMRLNKQGEAPTAYHWVEGARKNPYTYVVSNEKGNIALSQAYHDGWIAYQNGKMLEHTKVNGWANGWSLRQGYGSQGDTSVIIMIFWPQYLLYIGTGVTLIMLSSITFIYLYDRRT